MIPTRAANRGRKESCQGVRPPASWQGALFPGVSTRPASPPHPDHDERTSHRGAVVVLRRPCQETQLPGSWQGAPPSPAGAAASVPAAPGGRAS